MRTIGNIIWLLLGGVWLGLGWWLAGAIMALTLIGIPWARACFVIGSFAFWPFGREAVDRDEIRGRGDFGTRLPGVIGNVVWFVLAGWWLALGHLISAVLNALTIIGIPFAVQHLKLAGIALWPIGKTVVDREVAALARRETG
ncbi:hypothetical protein AWN76_007180 [Rhodothermaceae bacterium RA]|nr:hypothetical protein AWN76_007180 [Rhodothermaceae bacterium RA]